jgi:RNA polymerase sigma-70 factor (ECF subfamily)
MTPVLAQRLRTDRSFERIYRRHVGDVYRYALAVLHHAADAEDVTQTTFMNAYRAYERGERPRNAQNWLIAIAHNVCRQRFRQAQRRPEEVAYDDGIGDVVPEDERGPSAEDIQRALGHLAFNQRAALVMRELEGRSYNEIAEILDLSVSAVETLLFRARRALREQLEGALTCIEAERAISRQADGKLSRAERGALRAHLRECRECERLARSQRAQRTAFKALAAVPVPTSLTSLFGGGGVAGGALAAKAAAVLAAGAVTTGVGIEGARRIDAARSSEATAAPAPSTASRPTPPADPAYDRPWRPVAVVARSTAKAAQNPKQPMTKANARAKAPTQRGRATAPGQQKKSEAASSNPTNAKAKPKPVHTAKAKKSPARSVRPNTGRPQKPKKPKAQPVAKKQAKRAPAAGKQQGKAP